MDKMKWVRRVVAALALCLFFAGLAGVFSPAWQAGLHGAARVQFVPALLGALSGMKAACAVLAALVVLTLLFGRVYCSWVCPLGIMQDVANRLAQPLRRGREKRQARYTPNHWAVRAVFAAAAFGALAAGSAIVLSWLDPYTLAARFGAAVLNPLANSLAGEGGDWERYGAWPLALACLGVLPALAMAVFRGRLYCNTICPVGAVLGLLARFAPFAPHINPSACGRCAQCMRSCKAHAVDLKTMTVDATRCVGCYDCVSNCRNGAMGIGFRNPFRASSRAARRASRRKPPAACKGADAPASATRRAFLGLGAAAVASAALPEPSLPRPTDNPAAPGCNSAAGAIPAGAGDLGRFLGHCTGCGLCITACPTGVLRPSLLVHGFRGVMKPWLDYSRGYCRHDCHACAEACPAGALAPMPLKEKQRTQIALADYLQKNCNVWNIGHACARCADACPTGALTAEEVTVPFIHADKCSGCRKCSRVCPHGAITMVEIPGRVKANGKPRLLAVADRSRCIGCGACFQTCDKHRAIEGRSLQAPHFEPRLCIGCGACAHVCPAPQKALALTPRAVHLTAETDA